MLKFKNIEVVFVVEFQPPRELSYLSIFSRNGLLSSNSGPLGLLKIMSDSLASSAFKSFSVEIPGVEFKFAFGFRILLG